VIGNADRVRGLVEDVWNAPAMANAFRGRVAGCEEPEPTPEPEPTALPEAESDDPTGTEMRGDGVSADDGAAPLPIGDVITDPVTGQQFDAETGLPIDPTTGRPYDPADGD
jgi:hypothetical protein